MTAGPVWAVVVAAGDGRRLGADRPKAFVGLGGRPLLAHSVDMLEAHDRVDRIVLVVPAGWEEPASLLADELVAGKVAAAVAGGPARALSVAAGLREVAADAGAVLVHDAARPFASPALVDRVLAALAEADGAVPAVPVTDTVKRVRGGEVTETLERSELRAVQTPQAFRAGALRRAYDRPDGELRDATDCACLVERSGGRVVAVEGDAANVKITDAEDLARAEAALGRAGERRPARRDRGGRPRVRGGEAPGAGGRRHSPRSRPRRPFRRRRRLPRGVRRASGRGRDGRHRQPLSVR